MTNANLLKSTDRIEDYLALFHDIVDSSLSGHSRNIENLRRRAIWTFSELGFPTTKNEEWKYTSTKQLTKQAFEPISHFPTTTLSKEVIDTHGLLDTVTRRLVFVDGRLAPEYSSVEALQSDIQLANLMGVIQSYPDWVEGRIGKYADVKESAFTAMNTAFFDHGVYLYIPPDKVVKEPIYLLYITTGQQESTMAHPRNLLIIDRNVEAQIVENHIGLGSSTAFNNPVTEIVVGENSHVTHLKIQQENPNAFHIATIQAYQERNSNFRSLAISLGGKLARTDINSYLNGEGCETVLDGLFLTAGERHVDHHTRIDHAKPHCRSNQLYKGILDGKGHGVFNGKLLVYKDAQKTDARQSNKNLILSDSAEINTKPQLEIFADDVKCTHGATVGQIEDDALFYLRSRGLDEVAAQQMLTWAFANEIIDKVKPDALKKYLNIALKQNLRLS